VLTDEVRVTTTMIEIIAASAVDGISDFEVYGFIATRLPQYDGLTGEALFNDWKQTYTINVYDPRATIQQVTVEGQAIPLVRVGSNKYTTNEPIVVIRESEEPILNANQLVEFKTERVDASGNPLPDLVLYSQRPNDVVGNDRVITIEDDAEPTIQYNPEKKGTRLIFSSLATGAQKMIATLVSQAEDELKVAGWTGNIANDGAWGKAVSDKVRERISEFWVPEFLGGQAGRWKTGVLVELESKRILAFGANQGTTTAVELDVVYFKPGYNPKKDDILDLSKVVVFEVKASTDGRIRSLQLGKLQQMSADGIVNVVWTKWKWQQAENILVPNTSYYRRLDVANTMGLAKLGVVVGTTGVVVALLYSDDLFIDFEEQLFILRDYIAQGRTAGEIELQKFIVVGKFKALVDGLSGGTADEYTNVAILNHIYTKLLPRIAGSAHWAQ
jgi:hypothetical protein